MAVRRATHDEMKQRVKSSVRALCAHEDKLRKQFREKMINKEEYSKQIAFINGRKDGMRSLLSYALWGELEE